MTLPTFDYSRYLSLQDPFDIAFRAILKWTPRTIIGGFAGYYSLGMAYDYGIMSAIDRLAIRILRHSVGYAGIGALMPTIQWYAAWGVRMTAALVATIIYDLIERIIRYVFSAFHTPSQETALFSASRKRDLHSPDPASASQPKPK